MPKRYISTAEQQQIIERADQRCEYCKCILDYSSQSFEIEHIIPLAEDDSTSLPTFLAPQLSADPPH